MKDYSAMTDFEINRKILEISSGTKALGYPHNADSRSAGTLQYHWYDYCNNPADAWPIILQHKINIDHRASIKAGAMAKLSGNNEIYAVNDNPLRAAMEVYLMAMDAGLLKD